jgi:hypothetical protein
MGLKASLDVFGEKSLAYTYKDSNHQEHPARSLGSIPTTGLTFKRILLNYQQNAICVTMEMFSTSFGHDDNKNRFKIT